MAARAVETRYVWPMNRQGGNALVIVSLVKCRGRRGGGHLLPLIAMFLTLALLSSACTGSPAASNGEARGAAQVGVARQWQADGVSLDVKRLKVDPGGEVPLGVRRGGAAVLVESRGNLPRGGVRLSHTLSTPVPEGVAANLAFLKNGYWVPLPTKVSADRRRLTAHVRHLSVWDTVYTTIADVAGLRSPAPDCSGGSWPRWVSSVEYFEDVNAPILWCSHNDPANRDVLTVKAATNRGFGFGVRTAVPALWSWSSWAGHGTERALVRNIAAEGGIDLGLLAGESFMPPGHQVHFGFTEDAVRELGAAPLVTGQARPAWVAAGVAWHMVASELGNRNTVIYGAILTVTMAQCAREIATAGSGLLGAAAAVDCVASNYPEATALAVEYLSRTRPNLDGREIGRRAGVLGRALRHVVAARLFLTGAEAAMDGRATDPSVTVLTRSFATNDSSNRLDWQSTPDGLGPLRIGMSEAEAMATGYFRAAGDEMCRTPGEPILRGELGVLGSVVALRWVEGRLAGYAVGGNPIGPEHRNFPTPEGVGAGSTLDEVRAVYGDRLVRAPVRAPWEAPDAVFDEWALFSDQGVLLFHINDQARVAMLQAIEGRPGEVLMPMFGDGC